MTKLNVHEAKTHLSRFLQKVQGGEKVIICKHGVPVAQIVPLKKMKRSQKRRLGLGKAMGRVTEDFFKPLTAKDLPGFGLK